MRNALDLSCGAVWQLYNRIVGVHLYDADGAVVVTDGLDHWPREDCGAVTTIATRHAATAQCCHATAGHHRLTVAAHNLKNGKNYCSNKFIVIYSLKSFNSVDGRDHFKTKSNLYWEADRNILGIQV